MLGRSCRFRAGPLVLGVLIGGAALRHFARCEHPARRQWRREHFEAWRKHHVGRHPWMCDYPQEDTSTEKSEEATCHERFAQAWRKHHMGRHPWMCDYPQEDTSTEKSEETA
jgi:hypothetical protein